MALSFEQKFPWRNPITIIDNEKRIQSPADI